MMSETIKAIVGFIVKLILQAICSEVGSCGNCKT
jgi:hypothetical protein